MIRPELDHPALFECQDEKSFRVAGNPKHMKVSISCTWLTILQIVQQHRPCRLFTTNVMELLWKGVGLDYSPPTYRMGGASE